MTLGVLGVAAPSANRFGRVSPTTAAHVAEEFAELGDDDLLILDGGACPVGIESTIVDCSRAARRCCCAPGMLTPEASWKRRAGSRCASAMRRRPRPRARWPPTTRPRATVRLMPAQQLQAGLDLLGKDARNIAVYAGAGVRVASKAVPVRRMPSDAAACAQELFAVLRELDATGVRLIWVETPPDDPAWDGVRDRLQRAAA